MIPINDHSRPLFKRVLKTIFKIMPTLLIILFILGIIIISERIKAKEAHLKAQKAAEVKRENPIVNVVIQKIVNTTIKDRINLIGSVVPWESLKIISEINGKITEVRVKEGDIVNKGDLLVKIDPRDYQNNLDSASAAYELALSTQERSQKLYDMELLPKADLDRINAQLKNSKAVLDNIKNQLDRCEIRSPMSGIVNSIPAKVGLYLNAFMPVPVVEIIDIKKVKINVGIPESDVDSIKGIEYFDLTIDALSGKNFKASRYFLSKQPDTTARLYNLELALDNPKLNILPGMFARVDIVKRTFSNAVSIPIYAVIANDKQKSVYIDVGGKAHMKIIETGVVEGNMLQVTKGLEAGDKLIIVGHRGIGEGQDIKVIREIDKSQGDSQTQGGSQLQGGSKKQGNSHISQGGSQTQGDSQTQGGSQLQGGSKKQGNSHISQGSSQTQGDSQTQDGSQRVTELNN